MRRWWVASLGLAALAVVYVCYCLLRPLSLVAQQLTPPTPEQGRFTAASLGLRRGSVGYIDPTNNSVNCRPLGQGSEYEQPQPTASLAKVITVQVVLAKHPLKTSESGPTITMSADDEARYLHTVNIGGSFGHVVAGEQISERQLIEGILLASANNMADSLAIWAYGSMEAYHQAANQWLAQHGLRATIVGGDASGFDSTTKSTPTDLCQIMLLAAKQPALVEIMNTKEVVLPTGDVLHTTNRLLGQHGIFAGKTGYTDEAGRGLMVASQQTIDGISLTTAAVSLGNDTYNDAFINTERLVGSLTNDLHVFTIAKEQVVGQAKTDWGGHSDIITGRSVAVPYWSDQPPHIQVATTVGSGSLSSNSIIGQLQVGGDKINLLSRQAIAPAKVGWRLSHPL